MSALLSVNGLRVAYGGIVAVNDVSFDLHDGQILGIIGPNGAGKTTVFDGISGFAPATGRVVLDGVDISDMAPQKRSRARLGRSFQDARLFPSLTVFETLCVAYERHINLRSHGVVSTALSMPWVRKSEKDIKGKVEGIIEMMGLTAFRDKFVSELSTGSRRIVDLGVIMAHDPKVLLLDEPSSGIAQRETEALGPMLLRIREQTGASLLVIEHDMPLIRSISDELLALELGSVMMQGTPDDVLNDPRLVSAYLGTDAAVVERSGGRREEPAAAPAATADATTVVPAVAEPTDEVPLTDASWDDDAGDWDDADDGWDEAPATDPGSGRRQLRADAAPVAAAPDEELETVVSVEDDEEPAPPARRQLTAAPPPSTNGHAPVRRRQVSAARARGDRQASPTAKKAGKRQATPAKKAAKKSPAKKRAPRKAAPAKRAPRKAAPAKKRAAPKKAAPKRAAPKKAAPKKGATKKKSARKSPAKKPATKKTTQPRSRTSRS